MTSLAIAPALDQALANLDASRQLINRSYLAHIERNEVMPPSQSGQILNVAGDVRIFRIERIVQGNQQAVLEGLTAAYTALGAAGYTVFLYLNSNGQETDVCIGTRGEAGRTDGHNAGALLQEAFKGHFAGSSLKSLPGPAVQELLKKLDQSKDQATTSVTAVTGVPALSTENRDHFMQGLERFIDAAERRSYQALILAEPVSPGNLDLIREGYEQVATQLSPLLKTQLSYGEQDSASIGQTLTMNFSESLGKSLALTETKGTSHTEGTSSTSTTGTSETFTSQTTASKTAAILGPTIGTAAGFGLGGPFGAVVGAQVGNAIVTAFSEQVSKGTHQSQSEGTNVSDTVTESTSTGVTDTTTHTYGSADARSLNETRGQTRQHSLEIVDKGIEQLLQKIDHHLKRINEAKTYGGWNAAAYFISDSRAASETLASIFLGLIRGENSSTEDFALSTWCGNAQPRNRVLEWLGRLSHPQLKSSFSRHVPIQYLTPATLVTGKEMAIQLSLPRRSTSTVAVVETQTFGRQVQWLNEKDHDSPDGRRLQLGQLRHLWENLPQTIELDLDQLTGHLFVTGSTGVGKSNTLYEILDQVDRAGVPFMVIEPAKGEYKHVFGHRDGVRVFGTNPGLSALLRINPFAFPSGIHVLEHVDRLVEIFNVCWPMYAAMPAVLKEAILQSYELAGWDLNASCNRKYATLFPTFADLLVSLEQVIEASAYSQEMKSNYVGALTTRVKSLTNGLNGQIFSADELGDADLFDNKVIVDLSRVGSSETKSLIMGVLIMRLSEYRMSEGLMNQPLRHVTVLEEAHNILRRTGSETGPEGAGMVAKSIEMLTNAIAEMRTYGEGFIIVDQSPHAVDIAAIRNTNNKIIMRLPDEMDRRLIGKAVALNDGQLEEIAKFPKGVAVVYQNDWLEPVLCQINQFGGKQQAYVHEPTSEPALDRAVFNRHALNLLLAKRVRQPEDVDLDLLLSGLRRLPLRADIKAELHQAVGEFNQGRAVTLWQSTRFADTARLVGDILECRAQFNRLIHAVSDYEDLHRNLQHMLGKRVSNSAAELLLAAEQCLMKSLSQEGVDQLKIYAAWVKYQKGRLVA